MLKPEKQKLYSQWLREYNFGKTYTEIATKYSTTKNAVAGGIMRYRRLENKIDVAELPIEVVPASVIKQEVTTNVSDINSWITANTCRYLKGDFPNFTFCNEQKRYGSYCEEHRDLCNIPGKKRHAKTA